MNKRDFLVSLKGFLKPEFKEELASNLGLKEMFLVICQSHIDYAFSILNENPYDALDIYNELNKFHDILGSMPADILDLSVDIIVRISKDDIFKAIDLVDIIEVDDFKIDVLNRICKKTNDEKVILIIKERLSNL